MARPRRTICPLPAPTPFVCLVITLLECNTFLQTSLVTANSNFTSSSSSFHNNNSTSYYDYGGYVADDETMTMSTLVASLSSFYCGMKSTLIDDGVCEWSVIDFTIFSVIVLVGMEILNILVQNSGWMSAGNIPVRAKHLDELDVTDYAFIAFNKIATPPFIYYLVNFVYYEPNINWDLNEATFINTLVFLPIIFIIYDFFYTGLHGFLHIRCLYGHIHKHHHHQKSPSRAQVDAVNVHPIEFLLGEYNHIFAVYLASHVFGFEIHILCVVLFIIVGGTLASMNHTRHDITIKIPYFNVTIYDSKAHDVHHRVPQSNYGQYTMLWDQVFGSFRPYKPDDPVRPGWQLDSATGKSFDFLKLKLSSKKLK